MMNYMKEGEKNGQQVRLLKHFNQRTQKIERNEESDKLCDTVYNAVQGASDEEAKKVVFQTYLSGFTGQIANKDKLIASLQRQNNDVKTENEQLKQKFEELEKQQKQIKRQKEHFEGKVKEKKEKIQTLKLQLQVQEQNYKMLKRTYNEKKDQYESLFIVEEKLFTSYDINGLRRLAERQCQQRVSMKDELEIAQRQLQAIKLENEKNKKTIKTMTQEKNLIETNLIYELKQSKAKIKELSEKNTSQAAKFQEEKQKLLTQVDILTKETQIVIQEKKNLVMISERVNQTKQQGNTITGLPLPPALKASTFKVNSVFHNTAYNNLNTQNNVSQQQNLYVKKPSRQQSEQKDVNSNVVSDETMKLISSDGQQDVNSLQSGGPSLQFTNLNQRAQGKATQLSPLNHTSQHQSGSKVSQQKPSSRQKQTVQLNSLQKHNYPDALNQLINQPTDPTFSLKQQQIRQSSNYQQQQTVFETNENNQGYQSGSQTNAYYAQITYKPEGSISSKRNPKPNLIAETKKDINKMGAPTSYISQITQQNIDKNSGLTSFYKKQQ